MIISQIYFLWLFFLFLFVVFSYFYENMVISNGIKTKCGNVLRGLLLSADCLQFSTNELVYL